MGKVRKNLLFQISYQLLNIIIPLITIPIITRAFGPEILGQYSYTSAIANYFSLFSVLGLVNYGTREIARAKSKGGCEVLSETFINIYCMQLLLSGCVIVLYIFYCAIIVKQFIILSYIQGIILLSVALDVSWFYFGIEEFKVTVSKGILLKLLTAIFVICFIKKEEDVYLYALIVTCGQLMSNVYLVYSLRKYIHRAKPKKVEVLSHFKPNALLFIPVVAASFFVYIDKIMLGRISGSEEVGIYEAMEKIINVPNAIIASFALVLYPRVTSNIASQKENRKYYSKPLVVVIYFSIACFFGFCAVSDMLVPLFLGNEYKGVISVLILGGAILIPRGIRQVIKSVVLLPNGKDGRVTIAIAAGAAVDLLINFILIPRYGAIGATTATVLCEVISCILMIGFARDKGIVLKSLNIIPAAIIGAIMFLVLSIIKNKITITWLNLLLLISLGVIIYISLVCVYSLIKRTLRKNMLKY